MNEENKNNFELKYVCEYIKNEGTKDINNRSSSLKQILKSVVTPKEISHFKSIYDMKNEVVVQTIKDNDDNENDENNQNENGSDVNENVNKAKKSKKKTSKLQIGNILKRFKGK